MRQMHQKLYGWFDGKNPTPTYDPPHDALCSMCGEPITPDNVVTRNLWSNGTDVSYFFRTHRTCAHAHPSKVEEIERFIIEVVDGGKDRWQ